MPELPEPPYVRHPSDPTVYRPLGVKITMEYAPAGQCWERRPLHSYVPDLEWILAHLRAMAVGLERPHIELVSEGTNDDPDCALYVVGLRDISADEQAVRELAEEKSRAEELAELARLRAKYPDA